MLITGHAISQTCGQPKHSWDGDRFHSRSLWVCRLTFRLSTDSNQRYITPQRFLGVRNFRCRIFLGLPACFYRSSGAAEVPLGGRIINSTIVVNRKARCLQPCGLINMMIHYCSPEGTQSLVQLEQGCADGSHIRQPHGDVYDIIIFPAAGGAKLDHMDTILNSFEFSWRVRDHKSNDYMRTRA